MMKSTLCAAALAAVAILTLAGCVTDGTIEGHQIRAEGPATVERITVAHTGIHANAPQWFKEYWAEYLEEVRGSYAVMAMDRELRAVHYVYCPGPCPDLVGGQHRSWKEVHYKHAALDECSEVVRRDFPAEKPACAVYAIADKVVWQGKLPWEWETIGGGVHSSPPSSSLGLRPRGKRTLASG